ncbi:uroporphyrinogen-III C-methyltransferase [Succinimonas sp.]|uniref:uroporphyrinogen-III C-methyltransferase n=1 Tax=Succinimonas sp. TaxID=1936151 RepID=UPI0038636127
MTENNTGRVYLVGAGPGDPELITVRGKALLRRAGAVLYDHLSSVRLLDGVPEDCELIDVGKKSGCHIRSQDDINELLASCAARHETVVRLKGGDPFVFGRGAEETEILRQRKIPYEIVPGVTSAVAVPASFGIPVTSRGSSYGFCVYTAHTREHELPDIDWSHSLKNETAVFLMAVSGISAVVDRMLKHGHSPDLPAAAIESGTLPEGRRITGTLSTICDLAEKHRLRPPAVLVVGHQASVDVRCDYDLLSGCRIAVCGTSSFANRTAEELRLRGAVAEPMPVLRVMHMNMAAGDLDYIRQATWLVFTSSNGVQAFRRNMRERRIDFRMLAGVKIAAVGPGTARTLEDESLYPDFVPQARTADDLAEGLVCRLSGQDRVALVRCREGAPGITQVFDRCRIDYRDIPVYSIASDLRSVNNFSGRADCFDYIVFGSAAGVRAFFEGGAVPGATSVMVCVGSVTQEALASLCGSERKDRVITAPERSAAGIAAAITGDWRERKNEIKTETFADK